ncbi:MAG: FKBP-type peptidyl-prolyl cis-trans isomerase [Phycisphaerales bacterium]|nr:FKBP-type peptidyl-prolyl cis-trans isomerase [Phycisphaerales bacterium]
MNSAAWIMVGMLVGGTALSGCGPKRDGAKPDTAATSAEAAAAPVVTDVPVVAEPPAPPRPEELAKLPSADPGWPKPGDKPVYTARTPGGVTIEDYVMGEGMPVLPGALVTVHFSGKVKDGERFQSTWASGQPETHALKDFLPGMQEGLVGMRKGGKRRLLIPAAMGFGDKGVSNDKDEVIIPPGSALVFDIELVNMQLTIREAAPAKP